MSYDDEDIYDRIQDARIEQEELAQQSIPAPEPRTIEGSLLSIGDRIALLDPEQWGLEPGTTATVARVFPFQGGATVECELDDSTELQAILYDTRGVTLLIPAGWNLTRHQDRCRWFAGCTNPAEGTVAHPVLGDVPTCRRCASKLDLELVAS